MPLSARDKRALSGGGLVIVVLLAYLLWPEAEPPPAPAQPPPVAPAPVAVVSAPPPPAAPTVDVSQLRLFGVMASGAVIGMADGSQRFVPVGREIVPGVALLRVELHHAVLATAAGEVRLGFDGVAPAASVVAAAPAELGRSDETLRYRLGLAPRMVGGRVSGFTMRAGADLPGLARAGIRPGDVILRVNGSALDEERREELAWQIANSGHVEFEIERGGRPLRLTLQGRPQ